MAMKLLSLILVVLVATDGIVTNLLIKSGIAHEGNAMLQPIAGTGIFLVIKLVGALLCALLLWDIYRHWPKMAVISSYIFVGIYACITIWNLILLFSY
jgi:hypothetical protein